MKKIAVSGSRHHNQREYIITCLEKHIVSNEEICILVGDCKNSIGIRCESY